MYSIRYWEIFIYFSSGGRNFLTEGFSRGVISFQSIRMGLYPTIQSGSISHHVKQAHIPLLWAGPHPITLSGSISQFGIRDIGSIEHLLLLNRFWLIRKFLKAWLSEFRSLSMMFNNWSELEVTWRQKIVVLVWILIYN